MSDRRDVCIYNNEYSVFTYLYIFIYLSKIMELKEVEQSKRKSHISERGGEKIVIQN